MCDKMKIVQGLCDYVLLTVKIAQELEKINSMYKSTYIVQELSIHYA